MNLPKYLISIDAETTGVDPMRHEIIEFAAIVVPSSIITYPGTDIPIENQLDIKIHPEHLETADPDALDINGYFNRKREWEGAPTQAEAVKVIGKFHQKYRPAGYFHLIHNSVFDMGFLMQLFDGEYDITYEDIRSRYIIDLPSMALAIFKDLKMMSSGSLIPELDLLPEKLGEHSAYSGALKNLRVLKELLMHRKQPSLAIPM